MTPLRQCLIEDLRLHGFAANTQKAYLAAVVKLAELYAALLHRRARNAVSKRRHARVSIGLPLLLAH